MSAGSAKAAASASLRETAKWLVGGVAATSAGVFAGSSLTHLGSLDFQEHASRLLMAIAGGVLGFVGLGLILAKAIAVLTVESVGLPTLAKSDRPTLKKVREKMDSVYEGSFPDNVPGIAALVARAEQAQAGGSDADKAFLEQFRVFFPKLMAEAGFQHVSLKFGALINALKIAAPLAILGFGLFAWAANPPDEQPPQRTPAVQIY